MCPHSATNDVMMCNVKSNKPFRTAPSLACNEAIKNGSSLWLEFDNTSHLGETLQHDKTATKASSSFSKSFHISLHWPKLTVGHSVENSRYELRSGLIGPLQLFGPDIEL